MPRHSNHYTATVAVFREMKAKRAAGTRGSASEVRVSDSGGGPTTEAHRAPEPSPMPSWTDLFSCFLFLIFFYSQPSYLPLLLIPAGSHWRTANDHDPRRQTLPLPLPLTVCGRLNQLQTVVGELFQARRALDHPSLHLIHHTPQLDIRASARTHLDPGSISFSFLPFSL
jgi:hypothetical protein